MTIRGHEFLSCVESEVHDVGGTLERSDKERPARNARSPKTDFFCHSVSIHDIPDSRCALSQQRNYDRALGGTRSAGIARCLADERSSRHPMTVWKVTFVSEISLCHNHLNSCACRRMKRRMGCGRVERRSRESLRSTEGPGMTGGP